MSSNNDQSLMPISNDIDWYGLATRAFAYCVDRVQDFQLRGTLGIKDVTIASGLNMTQIRSLEDEGSGLVAPVMEKSGEKLNRRYTQDQVLLICLLALVMHERQLKLRPALRLLLMQGERNFIEHWNSLRDTSTKDMSLTLDDNTDSPYLSDLVLLGSAIPPLWDIMARLVVIGVSAMLPEKSIPAQWIIYVGAYEHDKQESTGSPHILIDSDDFIFQTAAHSRPPERGRRGFSVLIDQKGAPSFLPVFINSFLDSYHWYELNLPFQHEDRLGIRLILCAPRHDGNEAFSALEELLNTDNLRVNREICAAANRLLWTAVEGTHQVIENARKQVMEQTIDIKELVRIHGLDSIRFWLYCQIMLKACPGVKVKECDILVVHGTALYLVGCSEPNEMYTSVRAMIPIDHLLSGFSTTLGIPSYVENAAASNYQLVLYAFQERVKKAAAIPIVRNGEVKGCAYLFSAVDEGAIFDAVTRSALQVIANGASGLFDDDSSKLIARDVLSLLGVRSPEKAAVLKDIIWEWVRQAQDFGRKSQADRESARNTSDLMSLAADRRFVVVVLGASVDDHFRHVPDTVHREIKSFLSDAVFEADAA